MSTSEQIASLLREHDIPTTGSVVSNFDSDNSYYVFVPVERDKNKKLIPSIKKLDQVSAIINAKGAKIEFMLVDSHMRDTEAGLRATLMHSFGEIVRNLFLSIENNTAYVWIDPKGVVNDDTLQLIREKTSLFLNQIDVYDVKISLTTNNPSVPGILACLKAIRLLAPIDCKGLKEELIKRKFQIPSDEWMNRRLDLMRKRQKIIRLKNGFFVLTFQGLKDTGTERGASSPDIGRLLALAHRKL